MKNLFLLLSLIFFLFSCQETIQKVPKIIIGGQIENNQENTILISKGDIKHEIQLNDKSNFTDTIINFEAGYYTLKLGDERTNLYLTDKTNIFINLDADNFDKSIVYKGKGAAENNFLAKKILSEQDVNYWHFAKENETRFLTKIDSFVAFKDELLDNYKSKTPSLDSNFYFLEKNNNKYFNAHIKSMYEEVHIYYSKDDSFKVSEDFYAFKNDIQLENEKLINLTTYLSYLDDHVNNKLKAFEEDKAFEALRIINRDFQNDSIKKKLIFRSAKKYLNKVNKLDEYWALISFTLKKHPKLSVLKEDYNKILKIQPEQNSPITIFKDKDDKEHSLSDFKGKYVYIDMWAQWCGPCKAEAPYLKKLEEKYADENITFLKISLDKDQAAWKNYITENKLTENSFVVDNHFDSEFAEAYLINSIPRFILLDENLKIIDSDAKRPSNKELQKQLDNLLNV